MNKLKRVNGDSWRESFMHIFSVVLVLTDSNNTETALKLAGFSLNNYKSPRQTRTNTKN